MDLICANDSCREISSISEWNKITKEHNKENFYPIDKCFEEFDDLEGMDFYCPKCKQVNDGSKVEPIE